jgi:hypothetical protein
MSQKSAKLVLASAAALMLLAAPASAGGLINELLGEGDCNCARWTHHAHGVRAVDYYVVKRVYVPTTVYVRRRAYVRTPVYVVDQGPHYQAPLTGYSQPTGEAAPVRRFYRPRVGYGHRYGHRYGYRIRHGLRHHHGMQHHHRTVVRFGHRAGMRHGMRHGMGRGMRRGMHQGMRHGMHRHYGPAARPHLVGGPRSHAHPRPAPRGSKKAH